MLTTKEVKNNLLYYLLYSRDFLSATTEIGVYNGLSLGDVVGLSRTFKFYEIEIKLNLNDLRNELNTINNIINKRSFDKKLSKYQKHLNYLKTTSNKKLFIPHRFYFSISPRYKEEALKTLNKTSYGLMDFDGNVFKIAKDLHHEKIGERFVQNMLQRLSRVNYNLIKNEEKQF